MVRSVLIVISLIAAAPTVAVAGSDEVSLKAISAEQWDREHAAHLLRRAGFGGSPDEIDRLAEMGLDAAVASLVNYESIPFEISPPLIDEQLYQTEGTFRRRMRELSEEERRRARQEIMRKQRDALDEIRLWWIERMATSPRPLEEKMTLFWHGHFTSGFREVRRAILMYEQNQLFRENATGAFDDLLLKVSRDRAMLVYLDGVKNRKQHPNENYARELMELFSLGVGAYTEKDIKEAARAFTGWDFDEDGFVFRSEQHDYGRKKFLGQAGEFDGDDIIDIIVQQPECSKFLAEKLLTFFCRPDPDKRLVNALAAEIRKRKFEIKPVLATLFKSRAFYAPEARGSLIKSPVELVVGAARSLGVEIEALESAESATTAMGQELFQPPNVKGWDGGEKWINASTLFTRYNTVGVLISGVDGGDSRRMRARRSRDTMQDGGRMMLMSAGSRQGGGAQPPFDPAPWIKQRELGDAEEIVRFFVDHLLASDPPPAKTEQLIAYLRVEGDRIDLDDADSVDRVRTMTHLICSMPEYQRY